MKTLLCHILAFGFLFTSCGQQEAKPVKAAVPLIKDSTNIYSPVFAALTPQESKHYSAASAHFFDSLLKRGFNGSVLVAKNGQVVYEKYAGYKRLESKASPVDEHTSFHLASVSKTFTGMAVLKLSEEGKVNIHDEVSKYLPGFPFQGTTVQMLLNHRSGLRNYVHLMDKGWDKHKFVTNADVLKFIIDHRQDAQGRPPGKHFEYSNTNYALLALIIEKASGKPYPQFMRETFFTPLKLEDTYVFSQADVATAMESYKRNGRPYRLEFLDMVYGDKNIFSTPRDLLKWDLALRSGNLFKQTTLDSAYMPYSFEKPGKRNYGLAWRMLLIPNGKKLIYHNGWWHGNRTVFLRLLDEGATIIALSNNDNTRVYNAKKLCDLFGNYEQGRDNFVDVENDPSGQSGGENPTQVVTPQPVKKAAVHRKKHVHHKK